VRSNILARQNLSSRRRAPTSPQSLSPTRVAQAFHIEAVNNAPQSDACLRMDGGGCRSDLRSRFLVCHVSNLAHSRNARLLSSCARLLSYTPFICILPRRALCARFGSIVPACNLRLCFLCRAITRTDKMSQQQEQRASTHVVS